MKIGLQSYIVRIRRLTLTAILATAAVLAVGATVTTQAQTYSVLYSFQCEPDGQYPSAGLVEDKARNLYGVTSYGGAYNNGTVFKLTPSGTETVLHSFAGGPTDGATPVGNLVLDAEGNMYGVTNVGGPQQYGLVFKVTPTGSETIVYNFNLSDGANPGGSMVRDAQGNFYGTTLNGGGWNSGVVFKLTPGGLLTVLHDFDDLPTDGYGPNDGLIRDPAGNLYGTTTGGGAFNLGTVFQLAPNGTLKLLHSFAGPPTDGYSPSGSKLLEDKAGNLYGGATGGVYGDGILFKVDGLGNETVLHNFGYGAQGAGASDNLTEDGAGNLYGTASGAGSATCECGVLFKLSPTRQEFVLHTFAGGPTDGQYPIGTPLLGSSGALYGTTYGGGAFGGTYGCGTVFKMAR